MRQQLRLAFVTSLNLPCNSYLISFNSAALMPNGGEYLLSCFMSLFYWFWKLFALYLLECKCNVSIIKWSNI